MSKTNQNNCLCKWFCVVCEHCSQNKREAIQEKEEHLYFFFFFCMRAMHVFFLSPTLQTVKQSVRSSVYQTDSVSLVPDVFIHFPSSLILATLRSGAVTHHFQWTHDDGQWCARWLTLIRERREVITDFNCTASAVRSCWCSLKSCDYHRSLGFVQLFTCRTRPKMSDIFMVITRWNKEIIPDKPCT